METTLSPPSTNGKPTTPAPADRQLARVEELLEQAPAVLAILTDTVDELVRRLDNSAAPLTDRTDSLLVLADQLTRPPTTLAMARTAAHFESLEGSIAVLAQLPTILGTFTDIFDEVMCNLDADGVALDRVGKRVTAAARATATVLGSDELEQEPDKVGIFGVLKAMRDPDVQRALGLAMRVAKAVGKALDPETQDNPKELTRG